VSLEEALEARGLADPRALYRDLLRRLRQDDPAAYEEAVRRYERDLGGAAGGERPVEAWIAYGRWLAERLCPGRDVAVDREGRARELAEGEVPEGALLLHLPEKRNVRALTLSLPVDPTPPQDATRELLVG